MKREQGVKMSLNHKSIYLRSECVCGGGGRGEERGERGEGMCAHVWEGGTSSVLTLVGIRAVRRKARHDVSTCKTEAAA